MAAEGVDAGASPKRIQSARGSGGLEAVVEVVDGSREAVVIALAGDAVLSVVGVRGGDRSGPGLIRFGGGFGGYIAHSFKKRKGGPPALVRNGVSPVSPRIFLFAGSTPPFESFYRIPHFAMRSTSEWSRSSANPTPSNPT